MRVRRVGGKGGEGESRKVEGRGVGWGSSAGICTWAEVSGNRINVVYRAYFIVRVSPELSVFLSLHVSQTAYTGLQKD